MLPGSERWGTVLTTPTQPPPDLVDAGVRTILVVDQFEELFTTPSPTQRDEYVDWLVGAAASDDMTVVVVVRSDYYAQAAAYPRLADLLAANTVLVGEMSPMSCGRWSSSPLLQPVSSQSEGWQRPSPTTLRGSRAGCR